jgi:hypothetical protein
VSKTFRYRKISCMTDGMVWVDTNGRCVKCADRLVSSRDAVNHLQPGQRPPEVVVKYKMWKQRDGSLIRIKDMDDHHLVATIRMSERRADDIERRANAKLVGAEDAEHTHDWSMGLSKRHDDLVFEAKVRGIDLL